MAYVECPDCGLSAYTAAAWSSVDRCVRCDAALPLRTRKVTPISVHPRFRRVRAHLSLVPDGHPSAA
jgi:hypothetical protein